MAENEWSEDALDCGYVLTRLPSGAWWHIHFGRGAFDYDCKVLGRRTNIFAVVQQFDRGVVALSPQFILTLDGEGVESTPAQVGWSADWGRSTNDEKLLAEACRLRTKLFPSSTTRRSSSVRSTRSCIDDGTRCWRTFNPALVDAGAEDASSTSVRPPRISERI